VRMDIDTALNELLLTRPVTKAQIKRAYCRMAKRFHPDKATDAEDRSWVQEKSLLIQQAYELLTGLPIEAVNKAACQPDGLKPRQTGDRQRRNESVAATPTQGGKECQPDGLKPRQTSDRQRRNESVAATPTQGGEECQPDGLKPRQTSDRQRRNESVAVRLTQGGEECQPDGLKPGQTSDRHRRNESVAATPTRGGKERQDALLFKWSLIACGVILIVALSFRHQLGTATADNAESRASRSVPIPDRPTTTTNVGDKVPHPTPDWEATATNNVGVRNLSTPSGRLVGHWRNEPYYTELYFAAVPPSLKWGTMIRHPFLTMIRHNRGADPLPTASIEVVFEACSGNTVGVKECAQEVDSQIRLEAFAGSDLSDLGKSGLLYTISEDGQTMTEESVLLGTQHLETYRYVDSRTAP